MSLFYGLKGLPPGKTLENERQGQEARQSLDQEPADLGGRSVRAGALCADDRRRLARAGRPADGLFRIRPRRSTRAMFAPSRSLSSAGNNSQISGKLASGETFHTVAPGDANVSDRLINKGVAVQVKGEEGSSIWLYMLYNSLPFLLILGISFFVMRQMQKNAGSGAMGFGKSRARMLTEKQGRVTFARRRRHRRSPRGASGNRRIPQGPGQVRAPRRQDPQGRAAGRLARHRQDAARPRHRG